MFLSLSNTVPAQAIFGLSKCEKVKAEITSLETKISRYLNNVRGDYYTTNIRGYDDKIFILTASGVRNVDLLAKLDPIPTIWKVSYNNPKCFTNTQQLRTKELEKMRTISLASYRNEEKYTYSKYCKGAGNLFSSNLKKMKECFISDVKVIENFMEYKSIYSY
jgi:hypothetical protein